MWSLSCSCYLKCKFYHCTGCSIVLSNPAAMPDVIWTGQFYWGLIAERGFGFYALCPSKNFRRQYHLFLFHLKVTVAVFGAITIHTNTLTSVAADPEEIFKCHGGKNCRELSCLYFNSRKRIITWMEWFVCDLLEPTEQLWAKEEDRELSQVLWQSC